MRVLVVVVACLGIVGCGAKPSDKESASVGDTDGNNAPPKNDTKVGDDFVKIGVAWSRYVDNNNLQGPKNLADLERYLAKYPTIISKLESREYVFCAWGKDKRQLGVDAVICYERSAPTQGGWVLEGCGTQPRKYTKQEFPHFRIPKP
jgi:hypothetical protein